MNEEADLLLCPFCGGRPEIRRVKDGLCVACTGCPANMQQRVIRYTFDWLRATMARLWNTRHQGETPEPELEPSTTTQFVLEMACGKGGRHGYAPISKFGTEADARAKVAAILRHYPDDEWRITRIDETKTIVYATPERAPQ